jgi:hypothetical protein
MCLIAPECHPRVLFGGDSALAWINTSMAPDGVELRILPFDLADDGSISCGQTSPRLRGRPRRPHLCIGSRSALGASSGLAAAAKHLCGSTPYPARHATSSSDTCTRWPTSPSGVTPSPAANAGAQMSSSSSGKWGRSPSMSDPG